ncbi:MAG TPA: hypothetical protein VHY84_03955 [Bryobacteraceae bacterium]|jgi:hypothetical protein|nr:hypothetical protein [Bryobacteraceae bacterium]
MPQSIAIGLLVLGGVLLLIAILGGNFKIFGAEIGEKISSGPIRLLAGVLGIAFIFLALSPGRLASGGDPPSTTTSPSTPSPTASSPAAALPATVSPAEPSTTAPSPATTRDDPGSTSKSGAGIVFDPPSNIRVSPLGTAPILCSVQTKRTINLLSSNGPWYATDACGSVGYIHKSQIKFSE